MSDSDKLGIFIFRLSVTSSKLKQNSSVFWEGTENDLSGCPYQPKVAQPIIHAYGSAGKVEVPSLMSL